MRLRRNKQLKNYHELNMPAMIDIVMLLLIFFMCTSNFVQPENRMDAALSQMSAAGGSGRQYMDNVEVELAGSGDSLLIFCDGMPCEDWDALQASLEARRKIDDLDVIVRGSEDVSFEHMVKAVDLCHLEGFSKVAFSARESAR